MTRKTNLMKSLLPMAMLAGLFGLASCETRPEEKKEKGAFCLSDTMQKMVSIDSVKICNIDDELHLSGEVSFDENKIVKVFPISSGQVTEVKVSFGDKVTAGQVLAVIRSADVAGNYTDLAAAEADVKIAKRNLDNAESLYQGGISSQREYEEAKQNYEKAEDQHEKIQSLIKINGGGNTKSDGVYLIKSPINGYIVEKKINAGNFIRTDNSENLFTVGDLRNVWVQANVFEADIAKVKEGQAARVTTLAYPDKVFDGKIEKVSEVLDPSNKAMRVRIRIDNPQLLLKPEMFTNVIVTNTESKMAVCIPSSAVVEESGKQFLVLYNNNCDLKVFPVDILKIVGDKTYLRGELPSGQKLITHNALMIYDEFTDNQ
jgi:cobalt-zinc-cadmium efflux system membrane fusion protein